MTNWLVALVLMGSLFAPVLAQNTPPPATTTQDLSLKSIKIGIQFYEAKRYQTALPFFERAVKENPNSYDAYYWLGRTQIKLGIIGPAIENLKRATALSSKFTPAYVALAQAYAAQFAMSENRESVTTKGLLEQALLVLKDAEKVNSKYAPIYAQRGLIYFLQGSFDKAVESLNKAISLDNDPGYKATLAEIYLKQGKIDEAAGLYADAVKSAPKDPELRTKYGTVLLIKGDCGAAAEQLNQVVFLTGGDAETYFFLGKAQFCLKNWKQAGVAYSNTVALSPVRYPDAYADLGRIYLELGDPAKAKFNLTKAVALAPNNADFHYWLGRANEAAGDKEGAKAQYQKALELRPNFPEAQEALARVK